jgi:hypothetical protein
VTPDEFLAGIHGLLERMDARIERSDRRWEEEQVRWAERDRKWAERDRANELKWEKRDREQREFMDALLERSASMNERMIVALEAFQAEVLRDLADGRDQLRANTQAVLRLIDERFGPEPSNG